MWNVFNCCLKQGVMSIAATRFTHLNYLECSTYHRPSHAAISSPTGVRPEPQIPLFPLPSHTLKPFRYFIMYMYPLRAYFLVFLQSGNTALHAATGRGMANAPVCSLLVAAGGRLDARSHVSASRGQEIGLERVAVGGIILDS